MDPRALLTILVASTLLLAGCTDDAPDPEVEEPEEPEGGDADGADADTDPDDAGDDGGGDGGDSGDDDPEPADNAPSATLSSSIEQGEAPVNVTFSIDGADEDDDPLTWTLDVGSGTDPVSGDTLPAEHTHAYTEGGRYDVVLTVSDGELQETASVTLNITQAIGRQGPVQTFNGTWSGASLPLECWTLGAKQVRDATEGATADVTHTDMVVDPASIDLAFVAVFTWAGSENADPLQGDAMIDWHDADGEYMHSTGFDGPSTNSPDPPVPEETLEGTVPDGAATAYFMSCGGADVSVAYEAG